MRNIVEEIRLNEFDFTGGFNWSNPWIFNIFHPKLHSLGVHIHPLGNLKFA